MRHDRADAEGAGAIMLTFAIFCLGCKAGGFGFGLFVAFIAALRSKRHD